MSRIEMILAVFAAGLAVMPGTERIGAQEPTRAAEEGEAHAVVGSLKISLRLEDDTPFLGPAKVQVLPEEGYEVMGAKGDAPGEYVFVQVQAGKYVVEVSAPGYLTVRTRTSIEEGRRQRTLFVVMKPRLLAKAKAEGTATKPIDEGPRQGPELIVPDLALAGVTAQPASRPAIAAQPAVAQPMGNHGAGYWRAHELEEVVPQVDESVTCPINDVLWGTGQRMTEFVGTMEKFTATEIVEHFPVEPSGATKGPETRRFAYVAEVSTTNGGVFMVEEFRDGSIDAEQFPGRIATRGLPAIALLFHPVLAGDFDFRCEGLGLWKDRETWQVHFAQRKDKPVRIRSYSINGRTFPVFLEGRAWIDPGNNEVVRLESELAAPVMEIELKLEHLVIEYEPVKFQATGESLWLPKSAELYVDRRGKRYYRRHTFTDFKLFNVETAQNQKAPAGSFTITNLSEGDVMGELTVIPVGEAEGKAVTLRFSVPAHSSVVKIVGPGKDVNLPPEKVASATFVHSGQTGSVKVDAHLMRETTLDVVPQGAVVAR